jgi:hypothetical protein
LQERTEESILLRQLALKTDHLADNLMVTAIEGSQIRENVLVCSTEGRELRSQLNDLVVLDLDQLGAAGGERV